MPNIPETLFPKNSRTGSRGFTLLEVMIALAVFAVASAALLSALGGNSRQAAYLEQRTMASWIARDAIMEVLIAPQWPDIGRTSDEVTLGDRRWELTRVVEATASEHLRRVEVFVAPVAGSFALRQQDHLAHLVGFRGEH
ncbi:general secretion pathway protein I [Desulfurispirillum indicum S5]|uniref:Type II secretion system protein I n=1 Tax=Desulfurispirillum indicum (strain ATCC BAA-1389 / DSM 22839 / S5) TaxID=653733 RepID=E6W4T8_DESIS|nr:type II secretion system minor pseudopilin GspI [Desulfurispirillum indicum]ADU64816.1 general secretion pathway protein I [Desulfurispirillum indicum S5]